MAVLQQKSEGGNPAFSTDRVSQTRYPARIIRVLDQYGVERRKYQSEDMELRDVSQFFFAVREGEEIKFLKTWEMKQSTDNRSKLWRFLCGILGKEPSLGWDYAELEGQECLVLVEHKESRTGVPYSVVEAAKPIAEPGLYDMTGSSPEMSEPIIQSKVDDINKAVANSTDHPAAPDAAQKLAEDFNNDTIDLSKIDF